ncbi:MAG: hypothetical protein BWK73_51990 [Thiothrix lacustris]|uniref:Uncharacterized protein n=1 Tax=Thiothrix lacustris TaxID=525917 RepID=A0A1Y1Q7Y1_9GAMM|nr:MAG: hypothetical protein BWK73_51990 [Thiothrix lacustris]
MGNNLFVFAAVMMYYFVNMSTVGIILRTKKEVRLKNQNVFTNKNDLYHSMKEIELGIMGSVKAFVILKLKS